MLIRSTKTGLVLLLCLLLGLHWGMLQIVAWTGMVIDYAQTAPLRTALSETFDGKHPCKLCQFIAKAKKSEKRQNTHSSTGRLDLFAAAPATVFFPPLLQAMNPRVVGSMAERYEAPPTPPPLSELLA